MSTWKTILGFTPAATLPCTLACHDVELGETCFVAELEPTPITTTLRDVAIPFNGAEHVIAVGDSGAILLRVDGAWTARDAVGDSSWSGVAVTEEGVIVAVGAGGSIARSDDAGATFLPSVSPTGADLHDVAVDQWGTGDWLAVGDGEILFARPPWQEFSRVELPPGVGSLRGVAFDGESNALAVGDDGQVLRSSDGLNWSFVVDSGPVDFVAVVHDPEEGEERWLLLGGDGVLYRDPSGETPWYEPPGDDRVLALSSGLIAGEHETMYSLWPTIMPLDASLGIGALYGAASAGPRAFAVGEAGVIVSVRREWQLACETSGPAEPKDR